MRTNLFPSTPGPIDYLADAYAQDRVKACLGHADGGEPIFVRAGDLRALLRAFEDLNPDCVDNPNGLEYREALEQLNSAEENVRALAREIELKGDAGEALADDASALADFAATTSMEEASGAELKELVANLEKSLKAWSEV